MTAADRSPGSTPPKATTPSAPERLPDGRDARTVGGNGDNPLESLGKAFIAPVEGADEGAHQPGSVPPEGAPTPS